ncbi:NADPH:quinone reductase [Modicisalibacter ilicicola DSM 19980]|uniref:NADPH:quinone reductase n=1 Tax=Modicisalibacter ilicicola DSM 19980 TaxID=1121942 RepID=A0A1M5EVV6_9GAMM|nr:zinc-dependent alcohol dehydrogenase family protein [Halomonas ilicicola]SHF83373.1 NADPH:quinone reductase [Halomonas ilicicola DSM 19980]
MPRMIRFKRFGPASVLEYEERSGHAPGPGELLLATEAIGVNWLDVLRRQDLAPTKATLPAGLGYEMAGTVLALGTDVDDLEIGDRVASLPAHGLDQYATYGDEILLPRCALTRYPGCLTPIEASVHYAPLLNAYFGLVDLARVAPGEQVLVTAASQAGGPYTVQLIKALGARPIAVTAFANDRDYLLSQGAEQVIVTEEEDMVARIASLTDGRGVDVVMDGQGGPQMKLLGEVLAIRGRLVLHGLQGGNETPFPACTAFERHLQFFVHCLTNFTGHPELDIPQDCAALNPALSAINRMTVEGALVPQIDRVFAFEEAVEAHRYLETSYPRRGRVVLRV